MTTTKIVFGAILGSALFAGGVLVGQTMVTASAPPRVTAGANYPNLQLAQRDIILAWNAATVAQKANANNAQFGSDINMAGRYLNQANDALGQASQLR
jgi:hypothetical protein